MSKFARSLRAFRGLWWLGRSAFESIQELHRRIAELPRRRRRRGPVLHRVEVLEDRTLLSPIHWVNSIGGDWNNPLNWDLQRVPTFGDTVNINFTDLAGNRPVVSVTTGAAADTLTSANPLVINGGSLGAVHTISACNSLSLLSGTLSSDDGVIVSGALFDYEGGSVGGPIVLSGGALAFGTGPLNPLTVKVMGGTTTVTGTIPDGIVLDVFDNTTLKTIGAVTNSGTILLDSLAANGSALGILGSLTNSSTGVIEAVVGGGGQRQLFGGTLINAGEIDVDAGVWTTFGSWAGLTPELDQVGGEINVAGFMQLNDVHFNFSGGTVNASVPITTANAGVFQVNNGTIDVTVPAGTPQSGTITAIGARGWWRTGPPTLPSPLSMPR
jgi:hypothetical protein